MSDTADNAHDRDTLLLPGCSSHLKHEPRELRVHPSRTESPSTTSLRLCRSRDISSTTSGGALIWPSSTNRNRG